MDGLPRYPLRAMVGVTLAKSLYSIPTWTKTVALVREHAALREAIGGECPSVYAAYRFAAKLRTYSDPLDSCIARVLDRLRGERPDFGRDLAIDASDLPAYANGQRYLSTNAGIIPALRGLAAVERELGRLKNEWALLPLRVRGIARVRLHADLTILAKLASVLSRARAVTLAA